jgi:hypothetical protein
LGTPSAYPSCGLKYCNLHMSQNRCSELKSMLLLATVQQQQRQASTGIELCMIAAILMSMVQLQDH